MTRLLIGTAQWGLDYGITNHAGKLEDKSVLAILAAMQDLDISWLDTAAAYGDAEERIDQLVPADIHIQTKISGADAISGIGTTRIHESLSRLGRESIDCILVHDWFSLSGGEQQAVAEQLIKAKSDSLVSAIGISAYTQLDLEQAARQFDCEFVAQLPVNALDQRFLHVPELFPQAIFQARSIFLQGLLIEVAQPFHRHEDIVAFYDFATTNNLTGIEASLAFIAQQSWLESIVIAPTTPNQLLEVDNILAEFCRNDPKLDFTTCNSTDMHLLDPRTWN